MARRQTHPEVSRAAKVIAEEFLVTTEDIFGHCKIEDFVAARFALVWILKNAYGMTPARMGRFLNRERASVRYALAKANDRRDAYPRFRKQTDSLLKIITNEKG